MRKLVHSPSVPKTEHAVSQSVPKPEQAVSKSELNVPKDEFVHDERAQTFSDFRTLITGVCVKDSSVNGVDVDKLTTLYGLRPTDQARKYLLSIKGNVDLLLSEQSANANNHEHLLAVSKKLDDALQKSAGSHLRLLAADNTTAAA